VAVLLVTLLATLLDVLCLCRSLTSALCHDNSP
jgi:hypothetical protein